MDAEAEIGGFLRHLRACRNAVLPGRRLRFLLGGEPVGWVLAELVPVLARDPRIRTGAGGVGLDDPGALGEIAGRLAAEAYFRWRDEAFDVRASPDGPVLAELDRGALPLFGVETVGVHVNGLVERPDGVHLWVGRRAADKALDPGKLDHIVAGGVPAGLGLEQTLVKEAAEEAAIPQELARRAVHVGVIRYAMDRPEGLRRDILHCYDLALPEAFRPYPEDGEVAEFELWPLERVFETVHAGDAFKFNVNLALIDLFLRRGLIAGAAAPTLRARLDDYGRCA